MDPVTKRWMPRFTKEHQRAQEKFDAIDKQMHESQGTSQEAWARARDLRKDARNLEDEFKAKVDEMKRTGQPDPDPEKTRALARDMDRAAEAADQAEQVHADAEGEYQKAMIKWRAAANEVRDAGYADPVINDYHEEQQREMDKDRSSQVDPIADPDDAQVAAASTDDMGSNLLAGGVDDGFVGDEGADSELAGVGQSGQLTDESSVDSSSLAGTSGDLSSAASDSQLATADMGTSGEAASTSDPADTSWVEPDATFEPEVAAASDPAPQPEVEEFVDEDTTV